jgi:hypothetical protein
VPGHGPAGRGPITITGTRRKWFPAVNAGEAIGWILHLICPGPNRHLRGDVEPLHLSIAPFPLEACFVCVSFQKMSLLDHRLATVLQIRTALAIRMFELHQLGAASSNCAIKPKKTKASAIKAPPLGHSRPIRQSPLGRAAYFRGSAKMRSRKMGFPDSLATSICHSGLFSKSLATSRAMSANIPLASLRAAASSGQSATTLGLDRAPWLILNEYCGITSG